MLATFLLYGKNYLYTVILSLFNIYTVRKRFISIIFFSISLLKKHTLDFNHDLCPSSMIMVNRTRGIAIITSALLPVVLDGKL